MSQTYHRTLRTHSKKAFAPISADGLGREERLAIYKDFLKIEGARIR